MESDVKNAGSGLVRSFAKAMLNTGIKFDTFSSKIPVCKSFFVVALGMEKKQKLLYDQLCYTSNGRYGLEALRGSIWLGFVWLLLGKTNR